MNVSSSFYSAIISERIHSGCCPAKRTIPSQPDRISVRPPFSLIHISHKYFIKLSFLISDINWTGRGGNVSASTYVV